MPLNGVAMQATNVTETIGDVMSRTVTDFTITFAAVLWMLSFVMIVYYFARGYLEQALPAVFGAGRLVRRIMDALEIVIGVPLAFGGIYVIFAIAGSANSLEGQAVAAAWATVLWRGLGRALSWMLGMPAIENLFKWPPWVSEWLKAHGIATVVAPVLPLFA